MEFIVLLAIIACIPAANGSPCLNGVDVMAKGYHQSISLPKGKS